MTIFDPPKLDLKNVPANFLAYIGDEVMNFLVKLKFIEFLKPGEIEKRVQEIVSKSGQAVILERILNDLDEEERMIVKRAMNSRSATRHGNDREYRMSTGLEALIGYLYLKGDEKRLKEILEVVL